MIDKSTLEKALSVLSCKGSDFSEVFVEKSTTNSLFLEDSKIDKISSGSDSGVGLRIVYGDVTAYAYVNSFDEKVILDAATKLASSSPSKGKDIHLGNLAKNDSSYIKVYPDTVAMDEKVAVLHRMDKSSRSVSDLITQVSARVADVEQQIIIANTDGLYTTDTRVRTRYMLNVIAQSGSIIQTGYEGPGVAQGWEFITASDIDGVAVKAAERAVRMLSAKPAPAGKMTVVLSGLAGGTMVHEACGHSLEADFINKKTSIFTGDMGAQVASPLVTVIDKGNLKHEYGFLNIDDEGTKTKENILIEKGILKAFMTDRLNANLLGIPLTGNGRRQSYRNKPVPRMTNTIIKPGQTNPDEIVASVKEGLFVVKMGGGQVNTTNGDFVFEVSEGYMIRDGKVMEPVRGATLTGNGPQVLSGIDMVGTDMMYMPGVCGKGDHAPVSDGQPTLRIPEIIVGGQA